MLYKTKTFYNLSISLWGKKTVRVEDKYLTQKRNVLKRQQLVIFLELLSLFFFFSVFLPLFLLLTLKNLEGFFVCV